MTTKRVVPRAKALQDVDEAIDHYLVAATPKAALGFVAALEQAYAHIGRHPATGSLRHGYALGLPELRSWSLKRFPYLVFYIDHSDHVDVWRVLHGHRDIPVWLRGD